MNKVKGVSSILLLVKNMALHQVLKEFSVHTGGQSQDAINDCLQSNKK